VDGSEMQSIATSTEIEGGYPQQRSLSNSFQQSGAGEHRRRKDKDESKGGSRHRLDANQKKGQTDIFY
jgi:hypothetical protein